MRRVLLALALLGFVAGGASADPTVLDGGVFIAHYCEPIGYTVDPPPDGWCGTYIAEYAIDNCNDQVNRIDVGTYVPASWYVLAAWYEDKIWCGTEFGFGAYDAHIFGFAEYNCCFPGQGLEIPTPGWPAPEEGIAFVITDIPWEGNFVPVMHFGGWAYEYYGAGVIPLDVDPPTQFAGFANCESPPTGWAAVELGGLGINIDGIWTCPGGPPPEAACCFEDGACLVLTEAECLAQSGDWNPQWENCGPPNPCPQPPPEAACCFEDGACSVMTEEACGQLGGVWHEDWPDCGPPNPCPQPGVCCGEGGGDPHVCTVTLEEACIGSGGFWHPEWPDCGPPNPCDIYTPTESTSWGSIKAIYR